MPLLQIKHNNSCYRRNYKCFSFISGLSALTNASVTNQTIANAVVPALSSGSLVVRNKHSVNVVMSNQSSSTLTVSGLSALSNVTATNITTGGLNVNNTLF
jgi:hypothetical protein